MSGTSLDGVDAVLAEFHGHRYVVHAHRHHDYPADLRAALVTASRDPSAVTLPALVAMDGRIADEFAAATLELLSVVPHLKARVRAVGSHGQTVFHAPDSAAHSTVQLGDPARIAIRTGITTVADFRRGDMALGGQGAPLVPAFHQYAFAAPDRCRVVVNIGGIANVTVLRPGQPVLAFDTGPGNTLLDAWSAMHIGSPFDAGGQFAASGRVCPPLLSALLADPYFSRQGPKSTGVDHFNPGWLRQIMDRVGGNPPSPHDVQATLAELTAVTIAEAITASESTAAAGICGGGAANDDLMARLRRLMPDREVGTTTAWGLDPGLVEACAFAWFARERLAGRPTNLPSVTGATASLSMGGVYLPPRAAGIAASRQV